VAVLRKLAPAGRPASTGTACSRAPQLRDQARRFSLPRGRRH
jgi:hypothetical protein